MSEKEQFKQRVLEVGQDTFVHQYLKVTASTVYRGSLDLITEGIWRDAAWNNPTITPDEQLAKANFRLDRYIEGAEYIRASMPKTYEFIRKIRCNGY
jgi:hypothetical protein